MQRIKKYLKKGLVNISLALGVITLMLLILELSLRIFTPFPSAFLYARQLFLPDKDLGYIQAPNVDLTMKQPEFTIRFKTNVFGFRDKNYSIEDIAKKDLVILGVGDSFSVGYGVEEEKSYLTLIESELSKKGKDVEVINASMGGYGPIQENMIVQRYIPLFNPKVVLLSYYTGNDISDDYEFINKNKWFFIDNSSHKSFYDTARKYFLKIFPFTYQYLRNNPLAIKINAFLNRITNKRVSPLIGLKQFYNTYDAEMEKNWSRTSGEIKKMNDFLKKRNISLFLVIIPSLSEVYEPAQENMIASFGLGKIDMNFRKVNTLLRDFATKNDISVIDLTPALEKENYYIFDEHLNTKGHKIAAELIIDNIWNTVNHEKQ